MSDFVFLVGRVSFVTPSRFISNTASGSSFNEVEIEGKGWVYLSGDEIPPKKGDYVWVRTVLSASGRRVVQDWRHLTRDEVREWLDANLVKPQAIIERPFDDGLAVEVARFRKCWVEALKLLGVRSPEKFSVYEKEGEALAETAYKISFTLYNELRNKK